RAGRWSGVALCASFQKSTDAAASARSLAVFDIMAAALRCLYMRAYLRRWLFLSFIGFVLATWIAFGQQARRIDDLALKNAGKTGDDWVTYGSTPGETRYSPLKQIEAT